MRSLIKWIFELLIVAMTVAIVVPVVGSFLLEQQDIKTTLDDWVFSKTGRHLQVDGKLGLKPGLGLEIYAEGVRYENAEWASRASAFTAERVEIELSVVALLGGDILVQDARIIGGQLWIERNGNRAFNLVKPKQRGKRERQPIPLPEWLELTQAIVVDSRINYLHPKREWEILLEEVVFTSEDREQPVEIQAVGSLQGIEATIAGSLGTISKWFSRSPSVADLSATLAASGLLTARGTVDDVLAWSGIDATLNASIDRLRYLSALFPKQPLDASDIVAQARFYQPETASSMQLQGIEGDYSLWGIDMVMTGKVEKLSRLKQIELQIAADSNFEIQKINANWSIDAPLNAQLEATLSGASNDLNLDLAFANVNTDSLTLTAAGNIQDLTASWQQSLPIKFELGDLAALGQSMGKSWPDAGLITGDAILQRTDGFYSLDNISVSNRDAPISLQGQGYLRQIGAQQQGKLNFSAEASSQFFDDNQSVLPGSPFVPVPDIFKAKAEILLDGQEARMRITSTEVTGPGFYAQGTGEIPDLTRLDILSFDLDGEVTNEIELGPAGGVYLPNIGPVAFSAQLVGEGNQRWNLRNLLADTTSDAGTLHLDGGIDNIGPASQSDISFALETSATELIAAIPGAEALKPFQQELSNVSVSGSLSSVSRSSWSINDMLARSSWNGADVTISGDVDRLQPVEGQLEVHITGKPDRLPPVAEKYNIPQIDEIDVNFSVVFPVENRIHNVDAELSGAGAILKVKGAVLELDPLKTNRADVSLQADDIAELIPFEHTIAPGNELKADLVLALDPDRVDVAGTVVAGSSTMEGSVVWDAAKEGRPSLEVEAKAEILDLKSLLRTQKKRNRFFSNDSLVPQWMQRIDGKIHLETKLFRNNFIELKDFIATTSFDQGELRTDFGGIAGGNDLNGFARIQPVGRSEIQLRAKEIPVKSVQALADGDLFRGGTFDADISLTGLGSSFAELLMTGIGRINLDINGSKIQGNALDTVGGDLFSNVLIAVNPYTKRDDLVQVECGAIHFDIKDGMATTLKGLALQTDRVTVLGGGDITFPDESVRLVIAPKPRKGFGISASTIAKMVRVGGTLSDPEIEADAKGFLKSGAAIGAAIFSGGLSLVAQGLLDRLQANSEVCDIARGLVVLEQDKPQDETKRR